MTSAPGGGRGLVLSCRWPSCKERPRLAHSSPSAGTGGWVILVLPGCGIGGRCWGVGWAPWGSPPPPGALAVWWARKEEHCQPGACLLPAQESSPTDRASVSSPLEHSKHLSFSPASQGILGIFTYPWAPFRDMGHFFPNTGAVVLGRSVRSRWKGRSFLDVRDLVVASGGTILEPSLCAHFLLWAAQSVGLCLVFPRSGTGWGDRSTSPQQTAFQG